MRKYKDQVEFEDMMDLMYKKNKKLFHMWFDKKFCLAIIPNDQVMRK